ncbi:hypothetical protein EO97_00640 [Methanosarcina sp. 2.H.T.1A.15]|nr:hypothetical protein EO97_00640 [Methanosarcina sp. 2.H.T.1A.15]
MVLRMWDFLFIYFLKSVIVQKNRHIAFLKKIRFWTVYTEIKDVRIIIKDRGNEKGIKNMKK